MTVQGQRISRLIIRAIGVIVLILVLSIGSLVVVHLVMTRELEYEGPVSPKGYRTIVRVSDRGYGPGADFYADVFICDQEGNELSSWKDPGGQQNDEAAKELVRSLRWVTDHAVVFTSQNREPVV